MYSAYIFSILSLSPLLLTTAKPFSRTTRQNAVTPPAACDVIPEFQVTAFSWFNSSHNLDCAGSGPDVGDGTTCFNSTSSGTVTCDPRLTACDVCGVPACYTGLPLQPLGYGPPDTVTIDIENGYSCYQSNPSSIRRYEVGQGHVGCGGVAYYLFFYGNSNQETSAGHIDYAPITDYQCTNGSTIRGSGSVDFEITCEQDDGFNATCTTELPFTIPLTSYTIS